MQATETGQNQSEMMPMMTCSPRIGTLGPIGTSSEQAALFYSKTILPWYLKSSIHLFPTFEEVLESLLSEKINECVVPHAFKNINIFYINKHTNLHAIFRFSTPEYGLAYSKGKRPKFDDHVRIATHHAPRHLADDRTLVPWEKITIVDAPSTSIAAKMLVDGDCDLAITNASALSNYGDDVEFLSSFGQIDMGWSVFTKRSLK
ncbi:MAG: hypothetical protein P8011_08680 [Acidihalobacter sp.]|uniref:hypothetical protein n=1 Tax=Acidihalobacter sp. TaxID=1872108 RepID=UPI00307D914F